MDGLSERGRSKITQIMSRVPKKLLGDSESKLNGSSIIDLSMAENWLIRNEVLEICKFAIDQKFQTHHLDWPEGFWGNPELLKQLSTLFNAYFHPDTPVKVDHIAVAPGAAYALDALLYNICEPGDGVLVPAPYWNGYNVFFKIRADVTLVPATADFGESTGSSLTSALEEAFSGASCPVKALVISNPHNPLGQCYPRATLEACLQFCQRHNLHFISDEVFALSAFENVERPNDPGFVSVISINPSSLNCDPWRVHMVWSMSKDFGCCGIKIGCTVTQSSNDLRNGLALAAHMNVSTLSAVVAAEVLASSTLPELMRLNSERLGGRYRLLTDLLERHDIAYMPCNAGIFVLAKIAPLAKSKEEEGIVVESLRQAGVAVASGSTYSMVEKGWARICFSVEDGCFQEALNRMDEFFASRKEDKRENSLSASSS